MNENTLGLISGRKAPCSGHANSSEYGTISPSLVLNLCSSELSAPGLGALTLSTATDPPPRRSPISTASVKRCLLERWRRSLSSLTSISCLRFFSRTGGFSKSASLPFTFPARNPCSTNPLKRSEWVPFRFLTAGLHIAIA